ncbi:MAG: hypothetical protein V4751_05570 [Pseudomonadota bacterium]
MSNQIARTVWKSGGNNLRHAAVWMMGVLALAGASVVSAELFGEEELRDPTRPVSVRVAADGSFLFGLMDALGGFGNDLRGGIEDLGSLGVGALEGIVSTGYNVSFIRTGGERPVAMINEQLVGLGDVIGEATVVNIEADSVTLLVNGQEQRVSSFAAPVKVRVD